LTQNEKEMFQHLLTAISGCDGQPVSEVINRVVHEQSQNEEERKKWELWLLRRMVDLS